MKEIPQKFKKLDFISTVLISTIICLLIGLFFWGTSIFELSTWHSQVLIFGISGSIIYSTLKYRNVRDSLLISILLLLAIILFNRSKNFIFISRDVLFFAALYLSIYFYYSWLIPTLKGVKYIRAMGLAFLIAIADLIFGVIQIMIVAYSIDRQMANIPTAMFVYIKAGTVVGLGLGLGFDIADTTIKKVKQSRRERKYKLSKVK